MAATPPSAPVPYVLPLLPPSPSFPPGPKFSLPLLERPSFAPMFPANRQINNFDVAGYPIYTCNFGHSSGCTARYVRDLLEQAGTALVNNRQFAEVGAALVGHAQNQQRAVIMGGRPTPACSSVAFTMRCAMV